MILLPSRLGIKILKNSIGTKEGHGILEDEFSQSVPGSMRVLDQASVVLYVSWLGRVFNVKQWERQKSTLALEGEGPRAQWWKLVWCGATVYGVTDGATVLVEPVGREWSIWWGSHSQWRIWCNRWLELLISVTGFGSSPAKWGWFFMIF